MSLLAGNLWWLSPWCGNEQFARNSGLNRECWPLARTVAKVDPRSPTDIDVQIGARIRARRKALGISQTSLAEQLGVTFQQIQKYENGRNRISARTLLQAALVLGADYVDLLPSLGTKGPRTSTLNTAELAALSVHFEKLNTRGRRSLVSIARSLTDDPEMTRAKPGKK